MRRSKYQAVSTCRSYSRYWTWMANRCSAISTISHRLRSMPTITRRPIRRAITITRNTTMSLNTDRRRRRKEGGSWHHPSKCQSRCSANRASAVRTSWATAIVPVLVPNAAASIRPRRAEDGRAATVPCGRLSASTAEKAALATSAMISRARSSACAVPCIRSSGAYNLHPTCSCVASRDWYVISPQFSLSCVASSFVCASASVGAVPFERLVRLFA